MGTLAPISYPSPGQQAYLPIESKTQLQLLQIIIISVLRTLQLVTNPTTTVQSNNNRKLEPSPCYWIGCPCQPAIYSSLCLTLQLITTSGPPHHVIGSAAPVNLQFRPPSVSHSNDHHQFIAAPTSMNELDKEISLEGLDNLILDCLNNSSEEPIKDVATKDQLVIQQVGPLSVEMMTQLQLNHNVIGNSGPPNHMIRSAAPANLQFRPPSVFLAAEQYQFDGNSGPHHTIRSAAPANLHRSPSVPPATNHHQFIATPTSINELEQLVFEG
ncbi:hypothetical protein CRG98_024105 [Punica granatum]|uniref:Uncharacterized protein n=1 Tax=Punica granatum TaxID=22663 RepID=A0A2I0JHK3_PUNGR|nr:hypothetical protein CRG98_024105 [Punica granatum]